MEILKIAKQIESKIALLETMRGEIRTRSEQKAIAQSNYDRQLAITMIRLRNGKELELDGVKVKNPGISIIEKICKGICYKEKLEADKSEALFKSLISNIDSVKTEMNGLQSINRYLDNT